MILDTVKLAGALGSRAGSLRQPISPALLLPACKVSLS